jgi:hypothetical protein
VQVLRPAQAPMSGHFRLEPPLRGMLRAFFASLSRLPLCPQTLAVLMKRFTSGCMFAHGLLCFGSPREVPSFSLF